MNNNKIISFSLYGNNNLYNIGALKNAHLALDIYPNWVCYFYFRNDCNLKVLKKLSKLKNVKLISMENSKIIPMMWRFIPIFNSKKIIIVRDTDSRLNIKEKLAVNEWLKSNKDIHIMRDHQYHSVARNNSHILGGMWGARNGILNKYSKIFDRESLLNDEMDPKFVDQYFLEDHIYPKIIHSTFIHASNNKYEPWAKNFPKTDYKGFVGEIVPVFEKPPLLKKIKSLIIDLIRKLIKFYKYLIN